ncbi:molybdopterin cofactor-binding domain-containing protein [Robiginitalea sp. IMCC43444]|uniref:molybdopterin cofactor-binding domain-containing protein n=1 Tax=Robiginitalea sp. IMCC43444 TaxID=3459121 RepID=UPI0040431B4D
MAAKSNISRRKFLIRGGLGTIGVVAVGSYIFRNPIRRSILEMANTMEMAYVGPADDPMIWFEIDQNNHIILHSPKVEMGQGTFTGMVQLAAEELEINPEELRIVHAASATGNVDGISTGGSTSIASMWVPLRELAATFREMLKGAAAQKLAASKEQIQIRDGQIGFDKNWLPLSAVASTLQDTDIPEAPTLKPVGEHRVIGKDISRVDLHPKIFGHPIFGMDAALPDMLYGAVVRPTKIGARFVSADYTAAEKMPGVVKIISEADFIGVVAETYTQAENAKNAISVSWEAPADLTTADILEQIQVGNGKSSIIQKEGKALAGKDQPVEMEFRTPIGAHAQLEPNGVVASVEGDKVTLIISTQVVALTRKEVADSLEIEEANVNVIPTYLGGGFGRRLHTPHAIQAALMSRAVGRPVKYFFSRKEEFQHDMFRPPTHHVMKGSLDADGKLRHLEHHFVSGAVGNNSPLMPAGLPTILGADIGAIRGGFLQYTAVPNLRSTYWHVELPFATSWWRSLGLLANTFAIESFMDVMAQKAGVNAAEFRLVHIPEDAAGIRLKNVIRAAVEASGYTEEIKGGRAMGFAASTDAGTPCAQVAEVSVENNVIKVHKFTVAMDPGIAVNPDQVRAQCEGSVIMGMSAAMFEEMTIENGELQPEIYGPYQMALMKHAPKEIEVVLLQGIDRPGPVGEPPLGPVAAAIANAVFRLTGKRLTEMPLNLS